MGVIGSSLICCFEGEKHMYRFLSAFLVVACAAATAQPSATNGIAYGRDASVLTNRQSKSGFIYWVGCVDGNLEFQFFDYGDTSVGGEQVFFAGLRLVDFTAYRAPFFGKVADFWVEGLFGETLGSGRTAVAHFRVTESEYPGATVGYFTIDIFLPNSVTPFFSRIGATKNSSEIILDPDAGFASGSGLVSDKGMAYGAFKTTTNRSEPVTVEFHVAYNYLQLFKYSNSPATTFVGDRVLSFQCQNDGLFGKQAEFWLAGRRGTPVGTSTTAHVIVTDSALSNGVSLMYIALYHGTNLSTPVHERVCFVPSGRINILCK